MEEAGFRVLCQGKHAVMTDSPWILTISRTSLINGYTMGGIARDARLTVEEFRKLL